VQPWSSSSPVAGLAWWIIERPWGGATCWVNFEAKSYERAKALQSQLRDGGLDADVSPLRDGRPPALPVVTVHADTFQSEDSLEEDVRTALAEVGGGKFDQCRTPSFGD
jgi:hypothetical protein